MDGRVIATGEVAPAGPLDLDDVRAEIRKVTGAERSGDRLLERKHARAMQGTAGDDRLPSIAHLASVSPLVPEEQSPVR